jgi:hypothetical protein
MDGDEEKRQRERLDEYVDRLPDESSGLLLRARGTENDGRTLNILSQAQIALLRAIEWRIDDRTKEATAFQYDVRKTLGRIYSTLVFLTLVSAVILAVVMKGRW